MEHEISSRENSRQPTALGRGIRRDRVEITRERDYLGCENLVLANETAICKLPLQYGPGISIFKLRNGQNVFQTFDDDVRNREVRGEEQQRNGWPLILTGLRPWIGPEVAAYTYVLDNKPIHSEITKEGAVILKSQRDLRDCSKTMKIQMHPQYPILDASLVVTNESEKKINSIYPWFIGAMAEGTAILPLPNGVASRDLFKPLKKGSSLDDRRLDWGRHNETHNLCVRKNPSLGEIKIGYFNQQGWSAYQIDQDKTILIQSVPAIKGGVYLDENTNTQLYTRGNDILELECAGFAAEGGLSPGQSIILQQHFILVPSSKKMGTHDDLSSLAYAALKKAQSMSRKSEI